MGSRILSKNARSLNGKQIEGTAPTDGQVLMYVAAQGKYVPTTIATHALVDGSGTTYAVDRYNLGGTLTGAATILGAGFAMDLGTAGSKLSSLTTYTSTGYTSFTQGAGTAASTIGQLDSIVQLSVQDSGPGTTGQVEIQADRSAMRQGPSGGPYSEFIIINRVATYTDSSATPRGIQYAADYSATFSLESLVTKRYVDTVVASAKAYQGGYDANTNTPDLTTPIAGIEAGDIWDVTVPGTFLGETVEVGDTLTAKVANPTLITDWVILQTNLTPASVKAMYESNANTNAYTDAEQTKVGHISVTGAADLDALANANLANMPAYTIKGNVTGSAAKPQDLGRTSIPSATPRPTDWAIGFRQSSADELAMFSMGMLLNTSFLGAITTSGFNVNPNADSSSLYWLSAQAEPITVSAPSGTPIDSQEYEFRFRDNGTARAITWNAIYTSPGGLTLPTTTVVGRTMFLRFLYNAQTTNWELQYSSEDLASAAGGGGANLSIANRNANTLDVASDSGTDATVPAATTSLSGLMTSADKTKLDGVASGAQPKPSLTKTITIEEPTASEDLTIFYTNVAITIQEIRAVSTGTTPSTTYQIKTSSLDRSGAGTNVTSSGATTSKTLGDTASVISASIPSGSWIWLVTTAASGTGVGLTIHIRYTED